MVKKQQASDAGSVQNKEILQRMNFMYQASAFLSRIPIAGKREDNPANVRRVTAADLGREMAKSMKMVGQKTTVKIDPVVKRTLCKTCHSVLVPGHNVSLRAAATPKSTKKPNKPKSRTLTITCATCQTRRTIPAKSYQANDEQPLFARPDAGHIVLRGNEALPQFDAGLFTL